MIGMDRIDLVDIDLVQICVCSPLPWQLRTGLPVLIQTMNSECETEPSPPGTRFLRTALPRQNLHVKADDRGFGEMGVRDHKKGSFRMDSNTSKDE